MEYVRTSVFLGTGSFVFRVVIKTVSQGVTLTCRRVCSGIDPAMRCTSCLPLTMRRCFTASLERVLQVLEHHIGEDLPQSKKDRLPLFQRGFLHYQLAQNKVRRRLQIHLQCSTLFCEWFIQNQFFSVGATQHSTALIC